MTSSFRVATYNVHKCRGIDWRVSVGRIASVIAEFNPDLLSVQEITATQAASLSQELAVDHVFGRARNLGDDDYGNAVFHRLSIIHSESYDLTVSGREPRQCLRVGINLADGSRLQFFAVHLGTSYFERRKQAVMLTSSAVLNRPDLGHCRIIAGDLNEWTRGLTTRLLSSQLKSADLALGARWRTSYPPLLPVVHLDHIYYDGVFRATGTRLHRSRLAMLASDHLPLVCDFEHLTRNPGSQS